MRAKVDFNESALCFQGYFQQVDGQASLSELATTKSEIGQVIENE